MNKKNNLWEQFNLGDQNLDQGGGILYCLRYTKERIEEHRKSIILAIQKIGVDLEEVEEGIAVVLASDTSLEKSDHEKLFILLEELSVLNEAQEYSEQGIGEFNDITSLCNSLRESFIVLLNEEKIVDAYNLVTGAIPQIVRDLRLAHQQNKILSTKDEKVVNQLLNFAVQKERKLNGIGYNRVVILS